MDFMMAFWRDLGALEHCMDGVCNDDTPLVCIAV